MNYYIKTVRNSYSAILLYIASHISLSPSYYQDSNSISESHTMHFTKLGLMLMATGLSITAPTSDLEQRQRHDCYCCARIVPVNILGISYAGSDCVLQQVAPDYPGRILLRLQPSPVYLTVIRWCARLLQSLLGS
jgi:hypothetical protein